MFFRRVSLESLGSFAWLSEVPFARYGTCGMGWLGIHGIQHCSSVPSIVPVAVIEPAGIVGWRISYRHYRGI